MDELSKIENELQDWIKFFNIVVGLSSFTFSLACLSLTGLVGVVGTTLSVAMLLCLAFRPAPSFSITLSQLRSKKNRTPREEEIVIYANKEFFKHKRTLPMLLGVTCLMILTVYKYGVHFFGFPSII